jgi:zinc D-Ala-D-Ala carboxypeptidase
LNKGELMPKLSEHFTLEEMTHSQTAVRKGLDNTPTPEVLKNLKALCKNLLDPIRKLAGHPITVSSGYRSPAVNRAIGGVRTSQHVSGEAADINCAALGQKKLFDLIRKSGLPYDQCIDEFGSWVHVSFRKGQNRKATLLARKVDGKTVYTAV